MQQNTSRHIVVFLFSTLQKAQSRIRYSLYGRTDLILIGFYRGNFRLIRPLINMILTDLSFIFTIH